MIDDSKVFRAMTPNELAILMHELGFRAELDLSNAKLPIIESVSDGWLFLVFLFGQSEPGGDCFHAQIFTMQPDARVSAAICNSWNNEYNFATMYMRKDGVPMFKMDILLEFITKGYLRHCFGLWEALQHRFLQVVTPFTQRSDRDIDSLAGHNLVDEMAPLTTADISRGDLSSIERLLSSIADNTRTMASGNPGSDLRAIVNRLETTNSLLGTIVSNTRK